MTTPETTPNEPHGPSRWRVGLYRLSPFSLLWRAEAKRTRLVGLLGERDLAITRARWRLAIEQRDRCRDLAVALCGQCLWTERDVEFCAEHDIEVER